MTDTSQVRSLESLFFEARKKLEARILSEEPLDRKEMNEYMRLKDSYFAARQAYKDDNGKPYKPAA